MPFFHATQSQAGVAPFKSELQLINADEPTFSVVLRLLDPTLEISRRDCIGTPTIKALIAGKSIYYVDARDASEMTVHFRAGFPQVEESAVP